MKMIRLQDIWCRAALMGCVLGGIGTGTCDLFSQVTDDQGFQAEAVKMAEQVILFTDRNMYAVNESIWFRSFYRLNEAPAGEALSRVLYVELVAPSGASVARAKYPHHGNGGSGYLDIPPDVATGNYYLRSYTRWMRNFGPRSYSYVPLTIINPYRQDVLKAGNGSQAGKDSRAEKGPRAGNAPQWGKVPHAGMPGGSGTVRRAIDCRTERSVYVPGEEVRVELREAGDEFFSADDYCVTVVPAGLADTLRGGISPGRDLLRDGGGRTFPFSFDFLPEIRGVSVSGTVVTEEDQSAAQSTSPSSSPYVRVHFSMPGEQPEYFGTMTDERGRFIVTLPDRTGNRELFVAAEPSAAGSSEQMSRSIRIDRDFAADSLPFPAVPFELSPGQREAATLMVMNMQLSMAFRSDSADHGSAEGGDEVVPFYGIPTIIINTEEYVSLPTMAEIFENLVPGVYVKYSRGEPFLKIESRNTMIYHYPPLILMDRIPVFDQKAVMAVDPSKILKIEVINEVFIRGNMLYGGVIILTSREGDMASIDLPEDSYFFDYQAYHPPGRHDPEAPGGRIPDSRNTLLWMDSIRLDPREKKRIRFPGPSGEGAYHILVRGVSPRNEIIYGTAGFKVVRER